MLFRVLSVCRYPDLEIVHVNEIKGGAKTAAYMLQFDSVHGKWRQCHESADGESFTVDGKKVSITQKQTIGEVDWKGLGCQMVLGECFIACTNLRQIPCLSY